MKRKTLRISPELLIDFLKEPVAPGLSAEGLLALQEIPS